MPNEMVRPPARRPKAEGRFPCLVASRVTTRTFELLDQRAAERGISLSSYIEQALSAHVRGSQSGDGGSLGSDLSRSPQEAA